MKDLILKTVLPILITLLTALGAFSFKVEYTRAASQEQMGRLIVSMAKGCKGV